MDARYKVEAIETKKRGPAKGRSGESDVYVPSREMRFVGAQYELRDHGLLLYVRIRIRCNLGTLFNIPDQDMFQSTCDGTLPGSIEDDIGWEGRNHSKCGLEAVAQIDLYHVEEAPPQKGLTRRFEGKKKIRQKYRAQSLRDTERNEAK